MAQRKGTATAKKKSTAQKKSSSQQKTNNKQKNTQTLWVQIIPYLLIVAAIFLVICLFTGRGEDPGIVMEFLYKGLTGLFGGSAFVIPFFLVLAAIMSLLDQGDGILGVRGVFAIVSAILLSVLLEIISPIGSFDILKMFERGTQLHGGGAIGGLMGEAFLFCFKTAGSAVLVVSLLILSVLLCAGLTPKYLFVYFSYKIKEAKANKPDTSHSAFRDPDEIPANYDIDTATGEVIEPASKARAVAKKKKPEFTPVETSLRRHSFETDIPIDEDPTEEEKDEFSETEEEKRERINSARYEEVMRRSKQTKTKAELDAEKAVFGEEIISPVSSKKPTAKTDVAGADIIDKVADAYLGKGEGDGGEGAALNVSRKEVASVKQMPMDIPKPEYKYPPIQLLSEDMNKKREGVREELHDNATRLVNVLESFNVKTRIVGVSRGPTITRYELLPEAGTRVRSIANLVDDIALNLATGGVRIEAPIPGKAAVGIEVPNKAAETVYLRSLISSPLFTDSKSKITTCLGKDVGGDPILMDIKKMPHLLIAGATGMGKSVCINCLLVSLLYKASPEEVKLILIDPKKVEFSIYNGLPHLLVPVVSDPKKAAGSLTWAVNEMERRYSLIESVGVRDIESYNDITKGDPDREYMPKIIIVIDELADLMSTAPDDVETSIARLAAKARAAGMHLIIGTQRPSVDVITGVIKANIPSRIAFTVSSQVDSRTIIDKSGAENLIGRGDMLYNPVGAAKPIRVQGAFVSDKEVDSVVSYIKDQNAARGAEYSDDVMKQIEAEAAMCGVKKGGGRAAEGGTDGEGEGDPLINRAMEVAFESGKISTSLLQRRLSIGYGRAAKIIDKMEDLGYVSAPDGQRPRELLISKQDYMEISMRSEDDEE